MTYPIAALQRDPELSVVDWTRVDGCITGLFPSPPDGQISLRELRRAEWLGLLSELSTNAIEPLKAGLILPWGSGRVERQGDGQLGKIVAAANLAKEVKTFLLWDMFGAQVARTLRHRSESK